MLLAEPTISRTLMKWRTRVSAAAWVVVQDTHAAVLVQRFYITR